MSAFMRMKVYYTPVFKFHQLSKYFSKKIYFSDRVLIPAARDTNTLGLFTSHFNEEATPPCLYQWRPDMGHIH